MSDIAHAIEKNLPLSTKVTDVMTTDVVEAPADTRLFD